MSQTIQANPQALVESVARMLPPSSRDDFRNLMNEIVLANLTALSPGGNLIQAGGTKANASAPPKGVTHAVSGANAVYSVEIANPAGARTPIYHEISYSPLASFTKNVTTLPATTNTSVSIQSPGGNYYFRLRSSFDKKSWSDYQINKVAPIDAGYVSSEAISPAATFNQTNFATVQWGLAGTSPSVSISGTGGPFTPYVAQKGASQSLRPSATIIGTPQARDQFVGWDGSQFRLAGTLADILADGLEPVGAVFAGSGVPGGGGVTGANGGRLVNNQ